MDSEEVKSKNKELIGEPNFEAMKIRSKNDELLRGLKSVWSRVGHKKPDLDLEFHCEERLGGYVIGQPDPACHFPQMWSFLIDFLDLKSVFDIGCGEGHALQFFEDQGLNTFGIDGSERAVEETVAPNVMQVDLYKNIALYLPQKFDLVWCCEVVEHIHEEYLPVLIQQIKIADPTWVAITHAVPGQGGHHHVNCKDSSYWKGIFASHGFSFDEDLTEKTRLLTELEAGQNHFNKSGLIFKVRDEYRSRDD